LQAIIGMGGVLKDSLNWWVAKTWPLKST